MTIEERKSREQARLRQKILGGALRVFAAEGYGKVSMRKIAAEIDYSPTTIYRFFENKEELLQTIAAETYRDLAGRFEKAKADGHGDPLGALDLLVREYIAFCVEQPDMYRLYSEVSSFEMEDGILYERLGAARYVVYQSWFGCIRQLIEAGRLHVRDEVRVFLYLWDAVSGYVDHRIRHPHVPRRPLADDSAAYLELVFRGIGIAGAR
jgi:AcrR family transcriptional regulator